jgi:GNAT superfamily N-acetyltransferase
LTATPRYLCRERFHRSSLAWRGPFHNFEVNRLHARAFATRVFSDAEWDWADLTSRLSLGWVTARTAGELVGFVNVLWDGLVHAWLQDVMVAEKARHRGIGRALVASATGEATAAGCDYLHVDFDAELAPFYLQSCGFAPAQAGLLRL